MVEQPPVRATLALLLLCVICVSGSAEDQKPPCEAQVLVKRNTVVKVAPKQPLTVTCPLRWDNCDSEPSVIISWCKISTSKDCVPVNPTHRVAIHQERSLTVKNEIVSHLEFYSVTKHDDGLYRCEISGHVSSVSHTINISVSDLEDEDTGRHDTTTISKETTQGNTTPLEWLPYVYIYVGVVTLVGLVMLLSLLVCKRSSHLKKKAQLHLLDKKLPEPLTVVIYSTADKFQPRVASAERWARQPFQ